MSEENFGAALKRLSVADRIAFLETLYGVSLQDEEPKAAVPVVRTGEAPGNFMPANYSWRSYPITVSQAREVIGRQTKSDFLMVKILTMAVSNIVEGVAIVNWRDILPLTDNMPWGSFGRGPRAALHRSLRTVLREHRVENVDRAELLWEAPHWVPDRKGGWEAGELRIDGPAVKALQNVLLNTPPAPEDRDKHFTAPNSMHLAIPDGG